MTDLDEWAREHDLAKELRLDDGFKIEVKDPAAILKFLREYDPAWFNEGNLSREMARLATDNDLLENLTVQFKAGPSDNRLSLDLYRRVDSQRSPRTALPLDLELLRTVYGSDKVQPVPDLESRFKIFDKKGYQYQLNLKETSTGHVSLSAIWKYAERSSIPDNLLVDFANVGIDCVKAIYQARTDGGLVRTPEAALVIRTPYRHLN